MKKVLGFFIVTGLVSLNARANSDVPDVDSTHAQYPVVITPTRLRQSLADVPASVTVLTHETLIRYGVTNLAEALRLVPGMAVLQTAGNDYRINYHGTNMLSPRRMNVLIDGISVYRPGYSRVDWKQLPIAIDDIDRIEVTRGPNSVTYGPNSLMATINVLTKQAKDYERAYVTVAGGDKASAYLYGRSGLVIGKTAVGVTASRERDSGYDYLSRIGQGHDSTEIQRLSIKSHTDLTDSTTFDFQATLTDTGKQVPFADAYQVSFPDAKVRDNYIDFALTTNLAENHELSLKTNYSETNSKQSWTTCIPQALLLPEMFDMWKANPSYANALIARRTPTGGTAEDNALAARAFAAIRALGAAAVQPVCGIANQDAIQTRLDFELQDTYVFSDHLRVVSGVGSRVQRAISETYQAGSHTNNIYRAFGNFEYKPVDWININIGGYYEHDDLSESTFSPRVAMNARLTETQSVRAIVSKAVRTPDVQEQLANWSYILRTTVPVAGSTSQHFYQSATSPGGLGAETILSYELGYLLAVQKYGLLFDVKIFHDVLDNLISEKLALGGFRPTNNGSATLNGAEIQTSINLSSGWSGFLNLSYLDNDTPVLTEQTQYSRYSGSVGVSKSLPMNWRASVAYMAASGDGLGEGPFGRVDVTVGKNFNLSGYQSSLTLTASHYDRHETSYFRDFTGQDAVLSSRYDKRTQLFARFNLSF